MAFSARAASQEITVPSDATKKTFTIHSYRDTVVNGKVSKSDIIDFTTNIVYDPPVSSSNAWVFTKKTANDAVSYNLEVDISAGGVIQVPQNTWADNGGDTAIYTLYLKGSEIKAGSTFYFQCRFYAINGWEGLLVDPEYNKALNYKIDTVQPSWNPSGTIQSETIYLYKGNLSPSDFSGDILIELTLGTEINGYVKKAMIRVKVN